MSAGHVPALAGSIDCAERLPDARRPAQCVLITIAVAAAACGSPDSGSGIHSSREAQAVSRSLAAGAYGAAEQLANDWNARVAANSAPDALEAAQARSWLVLALVRNGKSGVSSTLSLAQNVLRIREQRLGPDHPDTLRSLDELGLVHFHRGEFEAALPLYQRSLASRRNALGSTDPALADSLDLVARTMIQLRRFDEATRLLDESQPIRERHAAASPMALAQTLYLAGLMRRYDGRFADALPPLDRALSIRRGSQYEHPDTALVLQAAGDVRFLLGATAEAMADWSEARRMAERSLGAEHPALSELLRRLGLAEYSMGQLAEGRRLREQALQIGERWLAPCDPALAGLVNDLAASHQDDGEYAEARRLYRRVSVTFDDCAGKVGDNPDIRATALLNEARLAMQVGDLSEAERLYAAAVEMWTAALGPNHPFVARGIDGLADTASARGRFESARTLYEQALAARRQSLGPTHPQVAWTLVKIAQVAFRSGGAAAALPSADDAIRIFRESGTGDEPDHLALALELRGQLHARRGQTATALADIGAALSERERILGRRHPLAAETRAGLAAVQFASGDSRSAFASAMDAQQVGIDHVRLTIRSLNEALAMAYLSRRPRALDLALSIAVAGTEDAAAAFDMTIRSRGVVLDELAARNHALSLSDRSSPSASRVMMARQRFANLLVRSLDEPVPQAVLDEARAQKEEAERTLAEQSAEARAEMTRSAAGFDEIRRVLPEGSVLVSYVQYARSRRPPRGEPPATPVQSVAAFVARPAENRVALIDLGRVGEIERRIAAWRAEAAGPSLLGSTSRSRAEQASRLAGRSLREAVWDPLEKHVAGAERIFVVPDGALSLVPLAALPFGESSYLVEQFPPIHYLSVERDLVSASVEPTAPSGGLLALGGPAFDVVTPSGDRTTASTNSSQAPPATTAGLRSMRAPCRDMQGVRFLPLDETIREVKELSSVWTARATPIKSTLRLLVAGEATEAAFKLAAPHHRVLHLATHGFFLGDDCRPAVAGTRGVGGLSRPSGAGEAAGNPLLLSGLALAGANRRADAAPDEDDGILTAEEVASLDLSGVEWAVLSACDTGVGEIKAGEGVFGLRRAFQVAGARTVIMSLWSVEDQATRAWMRALYEARFQKGASTADAVHAASLTVLQDRRAKGQSTHPFFWAAFVAAGDWR